MGVYKYFRSGRRVDARYRRMEALSPITNPLSSIQGNDPRGWKASQSACLVSPRFSSLSCHVCVPSERAWRTEVRKLVAFVWCGSGSNQTRSHAIRSRYDVSVSVLGADKFWCSDSGCGVRWGWTRLKCMLKCMLTCMLKCMLKWRI